MTDEQMEYGGTHYSAPAAADTGDGWPGPGYRQAIRNRLAGCGQRLQLALDEGCRMPVAGG